MPIPTRADCITILSAANRLHDPGAMLTLSPENFGLSRNSMETAALFLIERECFVAHRKSAAGLLVGALSRQGKWRLEQLAND